MSSWVACACLAGGSPQYPGGKAARNPCRAAPPKGISMLRRLFARLTGEPRRGQALFDLAVGQARQPHWYRDGLVPDTVEGRFAVLATLAALLSIRLEQAGPQGEAASVGLTERFVETLDIEVREMGVSDPAIGKQVRRLVASLAGRVGRWRALIDDGQPWQPEIERSLYSGA